MEDTSLDDFLDAGGGDDGPDAADTLEESDASDDRAADGDVEPARTTYQWAPAGVVCAACGETVTRRWQADEGLVCPDCKEW